MLKAPGTPQFCPRIRGEDLQKLQPFFGVKCAIVQWWSASVHKDEKLREWEAKIGRCTTLCFDMDGTLIDTNLANYYAYKEAIEIVLQSPVQLTYSPRQRFTRASLMNGFPQLSKRDIQKVVRLKERLYAGYLPKTRLNADTARCLVQYAGIKMTVLVTNCRMERALATLDYHGITHLFSRMFFRQVGSDGTPINKFQHTVSVLEVPATSVVVFENDETEIQAARAAGIPRGNIIRVNQW